MHAFFDPGTAVLPFALALSPVFSTTRAEGAGGSGSLARVDTRSAIVVPSSGSLSGPVRGPGPEGSASTRWASPWHSSRLRARRPSPSNPDHDLAEVRPALQVAEAPRAWSKGKTRSTTGRSWCRAMARFMSSNMAREPTKIPCTRMFLIRIGVRIDLAGAAEDADQAIVAPHPHGAERLGRASPRRRPRRRDRRPAAGQPAARPCPTRGWSCS